MPIYKLKKSVRPLGNITAYIFIFFLTACQMNHGKIKNAAHVDTSVGGHQPLRQVITKKPLNPNQDTAMLIRCFNLQMRSYAMKQVEDSTLPLAADIENALTENSLYNFLHNDEPLIFGDMDRDGQPDALVPFTIEGRGGGNNWDAHYAIFIQQKDSFILKGIFDRGGDMADHLTTITKIENDTLKAINTLGESLPDADTSYTRYIFKKDSLIEIHPSSYK